MCFSGSTILLFLRYIFLFRIAGRPYFINLDTLTFQIDKVFMLVLVTGSTDT